MTRKEYELIFQAIKSYRPLYDTWCRRSVIWENFRWPILYTRNLINYQLMMILQSDDLFDDIVNDAEEALANEPEIKSLNFR